MINIFFNESYFARDKIFLTKQIKYSKLVNPYYWFCYRFNIPISNNFIYSGPQKRINHLIKAFSRDKMFEINKHTFDNHYIVQFDKFGKSLLNDILNNGRKNQKILIGPLMDLDSAKELVRITNQHNNIKILVASKSSYKNLIQEYDFPIKKENVHISPSGIIGEEELIKNQRIERKNDHCLIYFKKRNDAELNNVIRLLESNNITYDFFQYGTYKNNKLIESAKKSKFGVILARTESQGFAIQELLSLNLPLLVWDYTENNYGKYNLTGTSVSYWSEDCGIKFETDSQLISSFDKLLKNINLFNPTSLIEKELTYEKYRKNLLYIFDNF